MEEEEEEEGRGIGRPLKVGIAIHIHTHTHLPTWKGGGEVQEESRSNLGGFLLHNTSKKKSSFEFLFLFLNKVLFYLMCR